MGRKKQTTLPQTHTRKNTTGVSLGRIVSIQKQYYVAQFFIFIWIDRSFATIPINLYITNLKKKKYWAVIEMIFMNPWFIAIQFHYYYCTK